MGNGEWGLENGEWGMGNGDWGMGYGDWKMGNGEWGNGCLLPADRDLLPIVSYATCTEILRWRSE